MCHLDGEPEKNKHYNKKNKEKNEYCIYIKKEKKYNMYQIINKKMNKK